MMGVDFPANYHIERDILTLISSEGGQMLFKIKNARTLEGLTQAKGVFRKE